MSAHRDRESSIILQCVTGGICSNATSYVEAYLAAAQFKEERKGGGETGGVPPLPGRPAASYRPPSRNKEVLEIHHPFAPALPNIAAGEGALVQDFTERLDRSSDMIKTVASVDVISKASCSEQLVPRRSMLHAAVNGSSTAGNAFPLASNPLTVKSMWLIIARSFKFPVTTSAVWCSSIS